MRPLFAIAPLALVLSLLGPTPHEADHAVARFKARFLPYKVSTQSHAGHEAGKPGMMADAPALTAMQAGGGNFDNGIGR